MTDEKLNKANELKDKLIELDFLITDLLFDKDYVDLHSLKFKLTYNGNEFSEIKYNNELRKDVFNYIINKAKEYSEKYQKEYNEL